MSSAFKVLSAVVTFTVRNSKIMNVAGSFGGVYVNSGGSRVILDSVEVFCS